jgi:gluconokinase
MTDAATRVRHSEALEPFVLAIDIGSTASRGDVFDASGRPLKGGRVKVSHHFTTGGGGTSEIDPDAVVGEVEQILNEFANRPVAGRIGGVALDTFASSLVGVTKDRRARTPCFTYADSRCAHQVMQLRRELDELEVQQRTGCRLHTSYLAPRLRWLRETEPDTFRVVRHWMSLGEYIWLRLLRVTAAGTSTAGWTGNRRTGNWDPELLGACSVSVEQLSEIRNPDRRSEMLIKKSPASGRP